MAQAKLVFVYATIRARWGASISRIIALVTPSMTLPLRHTLSEALLKRVTNEIRTSVVKLINQQTYVSLTSPMAGATPTAPASSTSWWWHPECRRYSGRRGRRRQSSIRQLI
ncbi:hypothetical protein F442_06632 [Phytophthora nicotianae P10297]|uniref:Uncharacterized protein n=1 Tax=Phytophthora nicotianae P10297 TaxID=1317064 RepID=W2ZJS6_PHYNI|nr:hypothetical protein F442_06632 [Phytophthora nicotianae P10297]